MQIFNFMQTICDDENIHLSALPNMERLGGVAIKTPEQARGIAYSEMLESWPRVSTIAHELAHHALGHFEAPICKEQKEREAQIFASTFTAIAMFFEYLQKFREIKV